MESAQPKNTIAWKLRQAAASLSKAERRIARVLLSTNLRGGLASVAALGREAQASGPSVLRFVAKLGFESYPAFQEAVRGEVSERTQSPRVQAARRKGQASDKEFLGRAKRQMLESLAATFDAIPQEDFRRAVRLLGDRGRQIVVTGGRFTQLFAEYLVGRLYQLRPNVRAAGSLSMLVSREEELPWLPQSAVLVVFDLRRYQLNTIEYARAAANRGVTVILITDTWLSPIADFAAIVLPLHVETSWNYDSFANCAMLAELLFGRILETAGAAAMERISLLESHQNGLLG
jgi:DNA-binding MurR/RpiR family transcriptional regulator